MNLNRNQELSQLNLGFCPLLEQMTVSYCSVHDIGSLKGCPSLLELDVSFNQLPNLKSLIDSLPHQNLTSLKFNDNLFSVVTNEEANYT